MDQLKYYTKKAFLILQNSEIFEGFLFGYPSSVSGEIVFNTGMVGYPETLTDPSYTGQLLVLTHPLIGNYGIPADKRAMGISTIFESDKIHARALIISDYAENYNHWSAVQSLDAWLKFNKVPALYGIDTRRLTKILREEGSMLAKIIVDDNDTEFYDPNDKNLIAQVAPKEQSILGEGKKKILLLDCGCKNNIVRSLLKRDVSLTRIFALDNFTTDDYDGVVVSNGPGNPAVYTDVVKNIVDVLETGKPILGICLGHQLISLASGAETYKLKYGHRGQNQPVQDLTNNHCYISSQNHGYAVKEDTLKEDWVPWFRNLNDSTNEGIRHKKFPVMSVQFHPEASPGPVDTSFLFDEFLNYIK